MADEEVKTEEVVVKPVAVTAPPEHKVVVQPMMKVSTKSTRGTLDKV